MPPSYGSQPQSPNEETRAGLLSPWHPPRQSLSTGRSSSFVQSRSSAMRDDLIYNAEKMGRRVVRTFMKMNLTQRILACVALAVAGVFGLLFLIFNERIFGWLEPLAERWKHTTGGWTILWAITFLVAFPPMIGYSTCGTTAGFVYGVWEGWLILATATVAGSFVSFLVSRTVLRKYVERLVAHDKRFAALTLTLEQDGLKLLCMIRLCPLPYSLSNGAMSTFPTVHPGTYALATAIITPKLLIHAFIGSRLAAIARDKEEMSTGTKAINWISIVGGMCLGAFTGWYIYRKTMARARELEQEEVDSIRDTVWRTGEAPHRYSDDTDAQAAVETLAQDSDIIDYFDESLGQPGYHDDPAEAGEEEDAFAHKVSDDEEGAIGLQPARKK